MSEPLAYLLTWTCYGTGLHGDERGSVDDEHNVAGTPFLPPDSRRVGFERRHLQHLPVELDNRAREIVGETIVPHSRHRRWELLAQNVRSNHVHVVVAAAGWKPEPVMNQLKAWATRRLREAGRFAADATVWTEHGSTRHLWNEDSVEKAVEYVLKRQGPDPK